MKPKNCSLTRWVCPDTNTISKSDPRKNHSWNCLFELEILYLMTCPDIKHYQNSAWWNWILMHFPFFLYISWVGLQFFFLDKMKYLWWIRYPGYSKERNWINKHIRTGFRIGWNCLPSGDYMLEEKEECEGTADMTFKLLSHGFYTHIKGICFL